MTTEVLIRRDEGRVAVLTLNRPDKLNALNQSVQDAMLAALAAIEGDAAIGAVVLTGSGEKAFAAGADIGEFAGRSPLDQRAAMGMPRMFDVMASYPKPVIAMIRGFCLGGGMEIAMSCDIRVAGEGARFGQPEINLGLLPGGGGTQRLPRLAGTGTAMRLILTGDVVGAAEALRLGFVDLVVPDAELEKTTMDLAAKIASKSPVALRIAKEAVRAAERLPIEEGVVYERDLFCLAFSTEDKAEGVAAFLEKRKPVWKGR